MKRGLCFLGLLCALSVTLWSDVSTLNMLVNPGFESEGGWRPHADADSLGKRVPASAVERGVPSGAYCGYINKKPGKSIVASIWQDVQVRGGESYLFSAVARGSGHLCLYYYDAKGTYIGQGSAARVNCAEWIHVGAVIKVMPKAVKVQVRFSLYGHDTEGEGWIDDVYWGPVPPIPATVRDLKAVTGKEGTVSLSWSDQKDQDFLGYKIIRSRYPDGESSTQRPCAMVKESSWIDRELPRDWDCCYYRVYAVNRYHVSSPVGALVTVSFPERSAGSSPVVWTSSPMMKVRRFTEPPVKRSAVEQKARLYLAKNEAESLQILVGAKSKPIGRLEVSLSGFSGKLQGALYRVCYTKVSTPTIDPKNVRPGLFADALPPWQGPVSVPAFAIQGIWLQLISAVDCPAGLHQGVVTVTGDGEVLARIQVTAEVWDFTVPVTPTFQTAFSVWPWCLNKAFGVKPNSPESKRLYEKYYWFMVERRMPPDDLPVPLMSPEAVRYLEDPRVNAFRIPFRKWTEDKVAELKKTADYLRQRGWLAKSYIYCIDEPTPKQYPHCRDVAAKIHRAGKDIRFLLTEQPEEPLRGAVDIWAPGLHNIDWDVCKSYREQGDALWWYTCVWPQAPYPTYLIDDLGVSHRVLSWLQVKHRIEGVLYWCVNICSRYRNSRYQPEVTVWEEAELFPRANGDGFLTYPGKQVGIDGPVSCIRLELIRDGNEDVEYFNLLRKELKRNGCPDIEGEIAALIAPVARNFKDWSKDCTVMEEQRLRLARRILEERAKGRP